MRQQKIIWFAIVWSTVIYLGMIWYLARNPEGSVLEKIEQPMVMGLYLAALVMFFVASVVPGRLGGPPQKRMVVALSLYEACAVFGLVAAFLNHDWRLYVAPWVLSLIGFMRVFPRAGEKAVHPGSV